jgi:hypothetical protein
MQVFPLENLIRLKRVAFTIQVVFVFACRHNNFLSCSSSSRKENRKKVKNGGLCRQLETSCFHMFNLQITVAADGILSLLQNLPNSMKTAVQNAELTVAERMLFTMQTFTPVRSARLTTLFVDCTLRGTSNRARLPKKSV